MLDLKIVGARVVDGTGNPWRYEEVGIRGGRIVATGVVRERARKRLHGHGRVLCPGFVNHEINGTRNPGILILASPYSHGALGDRALPRKPPQNIVQNRGRGRRTRRG